MRDATLLDTTRRHFFARCGLGLGGMARSSEPVPRPTADPPRQPHFAAKAKAVIFLFMAGGPSQLELFDHKPKLNELDGKPIPDSFIDGKRFAFMDSFAKKVPQLLGTRRKFARHGRAGRGSRECLPHTAKIVDDIAVVRSVHDERLQPRPGEAVHEHRLAQFGRPSMGAWVDLRPRQSSAGPAGLRRPAVRPARPARRRAAGGSGFLPTTLSGRPVPLHRATRSSTSHGPPGIAARVSGKSSTPSAT